MKKALLFTCLLTLLSPSSHAIDGLKYRKVIDQYYDSQSLSFLWLSDRGKPKRQTNALLEVIENSWKHGLNPETYHLQDIKNYLASNKNIAPRFFDQMISDAYLRYARDMSGMRVNAKEIEQDARYWRRAYDTDWLLQQAQTTSNLTSFLESLEPQGPLYARLKEELIRLSQHAPDTPHKPLILTQTKLLRPGAIHEEFVPILRNFLNVPSADWNQNTYDDELVQAVLQFQRSNNLKADGVIGPQTLALMNKTPRDKFHQIVANMERLRWLEPQKPSKYILVNIPSATLWAIHDEQIAHEMPVIVGRKKRPTLSFTSQITGVRFNPTWTVPKTIKKEDFLPLLQENPEALIEKGIDIKAEGEDGWMSIDPTAVDWKAITEEEQLKDFRMVQGPGPTNPLGNIRVLMPNQYNIYLHDTSSPEYFRASSRAASSGCVRVKEPKQLADFILSANDNWDDTFTDRMLERGKMTDIAAQNRIPVYLLYLTIWLNEDNTLTYGPDIYDWDKIMVAALYGQEMIPQMDLLTEKNGTTLAYRN